MAKAKKTPKESSSLFHNIMKASVKGNPKPKKKAAKKTSSKKEIEVRELVIKAVVVPEGATKGS